MHTTKEQNKDQILSMDNVVEIREIELIRIQVNPFQPRKTFATLELEELKDSILSVGLIHPPAVRCLGNGFYEIISGERRFRASKLANLTKIPVVVHSSTDRLSMEAALIENIQRVDLNPLEISKALKSLSTEFGIGQEELGKRVGKKRSTVTNYLRLLTLPKNIQDSVMTEEISMGHAKAILSLENFDKQNLLHELILRDDLSVREAEAAAVRISEKSKNKKLVYVSRDFFLEQLAEKIQKKLGTKVFIQGKGKKGRIMIDYYNLDDLDRLLNHFGVDS